MEQTDWEQLRMNGMKGFEDTLRRHEAALLELEAGLLELRATLPTVGRMETVWFRRYMQVMWALWEAGMPEDVEPERVGEWLAKRNGNNGHAASGDGAEIGSDTGSTVDVVEAVELQLAKLPGLFQAYPRHFGR